jgi:hypothetical protein
MSSPFTFLSKPEFDAVLSAARFLAMSLERAPVDTLNTIGGILTDKGEHDALSANDIHALADRLQQVKEQKVCTKSRTISSPEFLAAISRFHALAIKRAQS